MSLLLLAVCLVNYYVCLIARYYLLDYAVAAACVCLVVVFACVAVLLFASVGFCGFVGLICLFCTMDLVACGVYC